MLASTIQQRFCHWMQREFGCAFCQCALERELIPSPWGACQTRYGNSLQVASKAVASQSFWISLRQDTPSGCCFFHILLNLFGGWLRSCRDTFSCFARSVQRDYAQRKPAVILASGRMEMVSPFKFTLYSTIWKHSTLTHPGRTWFLKLFSQLFSDFKRILTHSPQPW